MNFLNLLVPPVYAQCPICVLTVGGGLLIAKKLGIDDLLVSIWISGLDTVIAFWLAPKIKIKILKSPLLWSLFLYFSAIFYFLFSNQLNHPANKFFGIDKIVLGMTVGMFVIFLAIFVDKTIRQKNHGKVLFFYQKVIIPVSFLIITTLIFKYGFGLR